MPVIIEWETAAGVVDQIDLDVAEREKYEVAAEVAAHPVESGAAMADHVRVQPGTFAVEGCVTNTPITTPIAGMEGATGSTQTASLELTGGRRLGVNTFQFSGPFDRVRAVDALLGRLQEAGTRFTIRTGLRTLVDYVLSRHGVERTKDTGNAPTLSLEFTRVRIVSTESVTVPEPAQRRGQRERNRGSQPAEPADNRGFAARLVDQLGVTSGPFRRRS